MEPIRQPGERGSRPRILQVLPALGEGGAESYLLACARHADALAAIGPREAIEPALRAVVSLPDGDIGALLAQRCADGEFDCGLLGVLRDANVAWATSTGTGYATAISDWLALGSADRAKAIDRLAAVFLTGKHGAETVDWTPRPDLLASGDAPEFVLETEHDGTATVRFVDGTHGRRPEEGTAFTARYRVGTGTAGNIGADSLGHVATADGRVTGVTNPLPAAGGVEPESAAQVRRDAPQAFGVPERAVTEADWA